MKQKAQLPIIDVCSLFSSANESISQHNAIGEELKRAFERTGLAYLRFNGTSQSLLHNATIPALQSLDSFFQQPASAKSLLIKADLPPGVSRGYLAPASESGSDALEWKEGYSWSCEWQNGKKPSNSFEAYNVWPQGNSDMQANLAKAFAFMHKVAKLLSRVLAEALHDSSMPDLESLCDAGESLSLMRAFHYFEKNTNPNSIGSSPHTDWGFMTLVAQGDGAENALQAYLDGVWKDIPPVPNTLVVNCSDFLSMLTRGRLQSPLHRVILTNTERTSLVYFQYPAYDTPMPKVVKPGSLSLLKDQSVGGNGQTLSTQNKCFGGFITEKWAQVRRGQRFGEKELATERQ